MLNSYVIFLSLKAKLHTDPRYTKLGKTHLSIIKVIYEYQIKHLPIKTQDILSLREIASPATLHKKLRLLVINGFIKTLTSNDQRVKQLQLTKLSLIYLSKLDKCMKKAIK